MQHNISMTRELHQTCSQDTMYTLSQGDKTLCNTCSYFVGARDLPFFNRRVTMATGDIEASFSFPIEENVRYIYNTHLTEKGYYPIWILY